MAKLDLFLLDRDVARGASAVRAWARRLKTDLASARREDPLAVVRHVSTKATFEEVSELGESEPLRAPMRRWIYRLAIARITRAHAVAAVEARQAKVIELEKPVPRVASADELVHAVLEQPVADVRRVLVEGLAAGARRVAMAERGRDEAIAEVSSRLGLDDPFPLASGCERAAIAAVARETLSKTDDLARHLLEEKGALTELVGGLVAREVRGVWPTRLGARWLAELFAGMPLLAGITPDLGPLPDAVGASSFARGLARFGAAYARAAAPRGAPFVLAHDPTEARPLARGALFATLVADPLFLRKKLGLSRDAAHDAARTLASTLLAQVRLEAARTLLGDARARFSEVEELVGSALLVRAGRELAHVLPRPCASSPSRLSAAILAPTERVQLVERFDEDWFQSPHALAALREQDDLVAPHGIAATELSAKLPRLVRSLEELAS